MPGFCLEKREREREREISIASVHQNKMDKKITPFD
jgi:hypothetical protein